MTKIKTFLLWIAKSLLNKQLDEIIDYIDEMPNNVKVAELRLRIKSKLRAYKR